LALLLSSLFGYAQKEDEEVMKATAGKLLQYLAKCDTASIVRLHADNVVSAIRLYEKENKEWLTRLFGDCKSYQMITKKYGVPKQSSYKIKDESGGYKEMEITLFDKKDTALHLTFSKIIIDFYPVTIRKPNIIYTYRLELRSDEPSKIKIEPLPGIKNN